MRRSLKIGTAVLILVSASGNTWASAANSSGCATPDDLFALQAAAVQQKLVVAAFTCQATQLYNRFVIAYQKDLQASDLVLQNFFRRLYGQTGIADYHSFKTRLANSSSIQSMRDTQGYCANAQAIFNAAFVNAKKPLTIFLAGQTTTMDSAFQRCTYIASSTKMAPGRPAAR